MWTSWTSTDRSQKWKEGHPINRAYLWNVRHIINRVHHLQGQVGNLRNIHGVWLMRNGIGCEHTVLGVTMQAEQETGRYFIQRNVIIGLK
ncbi:hypothetical protein [Stenotrophomonas phage CM2]